MNSYGNPDMNVQGYYAPMTVNGVQYVPVHCLKPINTNNAEAGDLDSGEATGKRLKVGRGTSAMTSSSNNGTVTGGREGSGQGRKEGGTEERSVSAPPVSNRPPRNAEGWTTRTPNTTPIAAPASAAVVQPVFSRPRDNLYVPMRQFSRSASPPRYPSVVEVCCAEKEMYGPNHVCACNRQEWSASIEMRPHTTSPAPYFGNGYPMYVTNGSMHNHGHGHLQHTVSSPNNMAGPTTQQQQQLLHHHHIPIAKNPAPTDGSSRVQGAVTTSGMYYSPAPIRSPSPIMSPPPPHNIAVSSMPLGIPPHFSPSLSPFMMGPMMPGAVPSVLPNPMVGDDNQSKDDKNKKRERWTEEEHALFLEGLDKYGRRWTKIQSMIPNKTVTQVRTHAYGYFAKLLRRIPGKQDLLEVAEIMSSMKMKKKDSAEKSKDPCVDEFKRKFGKISKNIEEEESAQASDESSQERSLS